MNTKMMEQFEIVDTEMLASIEGGTDWGTVGKGAVYGAGIGVAMCTVGGLLTSGSAWAIVLGLELNLVVLLLQLLIIFGHRRE